MIKLHKLIIFFFTFFLFLFVFNRLNTTQALVTASFLRCSDYTSPKDCNNSCSPKKSDDNRYKCRWYYTQGACKETSNICEPEEGGVIIGSGCYKISTKGYRCYVKVAGNAYHHSCDYIPQNGTGCSDNRKLIGYVNVGYNDFYFNGLEDDCGSEQIDWQGDQYSFISRIGPVDCTDITIKPPSLTPTKTPTPKVTYTPTPTKKPTSTPTPVPLVCQQMKIFVNGAVISDISKIKYGDGVTYRAFANRNGQAVKSMTFQHIVDGIVVESKIIPAVLTNGVWTATYTNTVDKYGRHRVRVIRVTPQ